MALLAAATKAAVMDIISLVTGVAFRTHHRAQRFGMAGLTVKRAMPAIEHKFRTAIMVKLPCEPCSGDVTGLALVTQCAFVHVLFFVTSHAGLRRFAVARGCVARLTSRGSVPASQWKLGLVVVEKGFRPLCVGVTCHAVLA